MTGLAFSSTVSAQSGPASLNISGGLFSPNGQPIAQANVNFKIEILDKGETCVLYSERHLSQDLSSTKGAFSFAIGSGTTQVNNLLNTTAFDTKIFQNSGAVTPVGCGAITLGAGDERMIRVSYDLGGGFVAMTPNVPVTSAPYSMVAETLQGKTPADLIQVRNDVTNALSQVNVEYIFTNLNYGKLKDLLDGTSTQYISSTPSSSVGFNGQRLTGIANPSGAQDAATKNYADSKLGGAVLDVSGVGSNTGGGKTLIWNQTLNQWEAVAVGGVLAITAGNGLNGGTVVTNGTFSVDTGVLANKILQLDGLARIPAVDGSLLTNTNAMFLQARALAATAPANGQVITWNNSSAVWEPSTPSGGTITALTGDVTASGSGSVVATISNDAITAAKIKSTGGGLGKLLITDATTGLSVGYQGCALGEVLQWTALGWACADVATMLGTPGVAVKTEGSSTQVPVVAIDAQGRVKTLTNVNIAFPVTTVAGRTGDVILNSTDISGLGTAALKNYGTASGELVELSGASRLPALDGSNLTNLNAVRLQTRAVSANAPNGGQVLGWNASASIWEPMSTAVGSVTSVETGTGLLGGTITSSGTLSVDVGTVAGKILQLNGSAQIPGVDGSLVSNINAIRIGTRPVAVNAPGIGQVLGWNNSSLQWEPSSVTSGTVTNVSSGTGLLGGPISSDGTLSVDVGTTAGKIIQLDGSARLPGVDGGLLVNVNASKIGTRAISSSAPSAGKYIGWNVSAAQWEPMATTLGTVTNVTGGVGLLGGTITDNGTFNVDVGVGANQIMQVTSTAQIPAIDGNLVTNVNAVKLQTRNVAATAPVGGQVLGWNSSSGVWEPMSTSVGSVTVIATGNGLQGGPISSSGTISVDAGVGPNQILQLDSAAKIPAVDGNLVSNVNAVKLQTRNISAAVPTDGQKLGWNSSSGLWEPSSVTSGTVTTVNSGVGLLGGPITSNGTLNVDVGVTGNKILQLDTNAQIPAVDGNLLVNINAVKLNNRNVSNANPGVGQMLGWNNSQWEPLSVTSGTVTTVNSGVGLLGGPITNNGTLNVDVGVGANQIMQVTSTSQIPAMDGNLVTNVNAVKLQTRDVSNAAPNGGQVLGWNSSNLKWEPLSPTLGTVTNISTGVGLTGGPVTANGTIAVDVGTGANQILQLNSSAKIPSVDGFLVSNVNAVKLQGTNISAVAPIANQVLTFNTSNSKWEGAASQTNANVYVNAGNSFGANSSIGNKDNYSLSLITNNSARMTLDNAGNVGIGTTTPNSLLDVNGTLRVTQICDGSGANCKTVSGGWGAGGSVNSVVGGVGLLGGNITTYGTLNIDVGVGANQILQLNGSALIPAVDGSLVSNVNAAKIGTRTISSANPAAGQYIGWNLSSAQWEPMATTVGTVTNVAAGTGLLGGPITNNGTLRVDVGAAANQIMQVTSTAQIPAIDGNLVTNVNAVKLQARNVSNANPGVGQVLGWNNSQWEPLSVTSGTVTSVNSGVGLLGGPITNNGTLQVDVGVGANQILQLNTSALIPAVDGSLVSNVNAAKIGTRTISSANPAAGQYIGWNLSAGQWEPMATTVGTVTNVSAGTGLLGGPITSNGTLRVDVGTAANQVMQVTSTSQIPAIDGNLVTNVNAVKLQTRDVSNATPNGGQVLGWNSSNLKWEPLSPTLGTVTNITTGVGLTGGPVTANGTIAVDVGTGANQILQLNSAAKIPSVDGFLVSNVNAVKLQGTNVSSTGPTPNQVLTYNNSSAKWEGAATQTNANVYVNAGNTFGANSSLGNKDNYSLSLLTNNSTRMTLDSAGNVGIGTTTPNALLDVMGTMRVTQICDSAGGNCKSVAGGWGAGGSVNSVVGGVGLLGGNITTYGTLNIDVGTAANQIMQVTSTAQIPAIDGNLVTNVNAVKLQTRNVSNANPSVGQVLGWNNSQWEPLSVTSGTVTTVNSGVGLLGGPITANGTLRVDVGIGANQILQLNTSALIPAVDGSLVSNVNAAKIGTRTISSANPAAGQYIGWNLSAAQWEPMATTVGTVTNVSAGTGLLGGPVTNNGTLRVDVGTAANQIMQVTMTSQIPAIDGNLVTNVNAVKLQTRDVSSVQPNNGQVLGWNSGNLKWEPLTSTQGTVTNIVAGTGLTGGPISATGTLAVDVGTGANQILQLNSAAKIPSVDGFLVSNVNAVKLQGTNVSSTGPTPNQVLTYNNSSAKWEGATTQTNANVYVNAGNTFGANSSIGNKDNYSLSLLTNNSTRMTLDSAGNVGIGTTTPNALLDVMGTMRVTQICDSAGGNCKSVAGGWGAGGSVNSVVGGVGLLGGNITTYGTLNIDVGVGANQILQLNTSAHIPAVDGSLLSNVNAAKIGTRTVSSANPAAGQYIGWNLTASQWEPMATTTGTVTNVSAGTGLLGGPITNNGTLRVDVGTAANQIMQVTMTSQIPAIDGNLVTNVNAVKLQTRDVSSVPPTNGQVLGWNNGNLKWEPLTATQGTVTNIVAGTGLTGGPISATGTLAVDVGTGANQILQLNSAAKIPNVDGFLVSNINAAKLRGTNISATPPSANQVLTYNNLSAQWEGAASATAANVFVNGGNSFSGAAVLGTNDANSLAFRTNGVQQMIVDQIGNVAIGSTSALYVKANGNVGIGTTIPTNLFSVNGSGNFTSLSVGKTSAPNVTLDVQGPVRWGDGTHIGELNYGSTLTMGSSSNHDLNLIANNSSVMTIKSGGNVGVGTLTPLALLDVAGAGTNSAIIVPRDTTANRPGGNVTNGMIRYNSNTSKFEAYEGGSWVNMTPSGAGLAASGASGAIQYSNGSGSFLSNNNLVIDGTNGRVGIGTAVPTDGLTLGVGTTKATYNLFTNAANYEKGFERWSGNEYQMGTSAAGTGSLRDLKVGTFGSGTINSTVTISAGDGASGGTSYIYLTTNGSTALSASSAGSTFYGFLNMNGNTLYGNAGVGNNLVLDSTTNASKGKIIINPSGGNVGIGTTSPSALFEVSGTGTNSAIIIPRDTTSNRPAGNATNGMIRYNTNTSKFEAYQSGTWTNMISAGSGLSSGGANAIQYGDGAGNFLANNNLVIDGTSGRIGVGMSAPTHSVTLGTGQNRASYNSFTDTSNYERGFERWSTNEYQFGSEAAGSGTLRDMRIGTFTTSSATSNLYLVAGEGSGGGSSHIRMNVQGTNVLDATAAMLSINKPFYTLGNTIYGGISNGDSLTFDSTSAGTKGNIVLQTSGGNVGIGTATPLALLEVSGTGTNSAILVPRDTTTNRPGANVRNGMIRYNTNTSKFEAYESGSWTNLIGSTSFPLFGPISDSSAPSYSFSGDVNTGLYSPAADNIALATNGSHRLSVDQIGNVSVGTTSSLYVKANGNIGIGTTTPNQALEVFGTAKANTVLAGDGAAATPSHAFASATGSGMFWAPATTSLAFSNGGVEKMRIDSTGKMGILNTSPQALLHVGAGAQAGFYAGTGILAESAGQTWVSARDSTNSAEAMLMSFSSVAYSGSATNHPYRLRTNNADRVSIEINGAVGFMTNTPTPGSVADFSGAGTGLSTIVVPRDTTANRPATGVNGMLRYNTNTSKFEAYENTGWQNIIGNTSFPLFAPISNSSAPSYSFSSDANTGMFSPLADNLNLATSGVSRLQVDQLGNVAIGTTSQFYVSNSGNVGIGTAAPNYKLEVIGTARIFGGIDLGSAGNPNAAGIHTTSDATMIFNANGSNEGAALYNGMQWNLRGDQGTVGFVSASNPSTAPDVALSRLAAGKMAVGTGAQGDSSGTLIAGAVGIGTTTPLAFLEVAGTGTNSAILLPRDTTANRPGGNARNGMIRYNTNTSKFEAYENTGWQNLIGSTSFPLFAPISNASAPSYSFSADANTGMFSPLADNLNFATSGSSRLQIDQLGNVAIGTTSQFYVSNNGNVGIGTTCPSASFSVVPSGSGGDTFNVVYGTTLGGSGGIELKNHYSVTDVATIKLSSLNPSAGAIVLATGNGSNATERMRVDYTGLVGIGTSSPQGSLQVKGPNIANFGQLALQSSTSPETVNTTYWSSAGTRLAYTGINGPGNSNFDYFFIADQTNSDITFGNNSGEKLRIAYSGNVGIGTATPLAFLEVAGTGTNSAILVPRDTTANRPGGNARNGMIRYNTNTSKFEAYENSGWTNIIGSTSFPLFAPISNASAPSYSFSSDANTGMFSPLADNLNFATSGVSRLQIDQLGNVAIGTASALFVRTNGNVGIGTLTPTYPLDVVGNAHANNAFYSVNGFTTDAAETLLGPSGLAMANNKPIMWSSTSSYAGSKDIGISRFSAGVLAVGNGTQGDSTGTLIAGVVGIGTTTPLAFLEVAGTGTNSAILVPRDTTANRPGGNARNGMIRYNTNTSKFEAFENTGWQNLIGSTSFPLFAPISNSSAPSYSFSADANTGMFSPLADNLNLATTGVSRMQIDQLGNVAIGTTSQFYVSNSGNVGLGTTNPGAKLDVNGRIYLSGGGSGDAMISDGTGNAYLWFNQGGLNDVTLVGRDILTLGNNHSDNPGDGVVFKLDVNGVPSANGVFKWMEASTELMRLTAAGNVGIGTTTPLAFLEVAGTGTNSAILVPRDTTANRPLNNARNGMIRYNTNTSKFEAYENTGWVNMTPSGAGTTASGSANAVQYSNGSGGFLSNNNIAIDGANGRLGVGVTSPTYKLQVNGTFASAIWAFDSSGNITQNWGGAWGAVPNDSGITFDAAWTSVSRYVQVARGGGTGWPGIPLLIKAGGTESGNTNQNGGDLTLTSGIATGTGSSNIYMQTSSNGSSGTTDNALTTTMTVAGSGGGRVGIGTTTPLAFLEVAGTGTNSAILVPRDTTANRPGGNARNGMIRYNTNTSKFEAYENTGWTNIIGSTSFPLFAPISNSSAPSYSFSSDANTGMFSPLADNLNLATTGVSRLQIDQLGNVAIGTTSQFYVSNSGNIGIGTTAPATSLHIITSGNQGFINLGTADVNGIRLGPADPTGGVLGVWQGDGTTKAGVKATFVEDYVSSNFRLGTGATLDFSSAGTVRWGATTIATIDSGLSRGGVAKIYVGNGTAGDSSGTLVAATVGIGTTTPLAFLEVAGTGTNSAILVPRDTTANRPGGNARNGMIRYNTNTSKFEAYENTGWVNIIGGAPSFPLAAPISNASAPSYSFSSDANTGMFSPLADNLNLATSGVSRLQVDQLGNVAVGTTSQFYVSNSGNVGIGTTSPTGKFEVTYNAIGVNINDGIVLKNNTAATAGDINSLTRQNSPALSFVGQGWKENATAASQSVAFKLYTIPAEDAASPDGLFVIDPFVNGVQAGGGIGVCSNGGYSSPKLILDGGYATPRVCNGNTVGAGFSSGGSGLISVIAGVQVANIGQTGFLLSGNSGLGWISGGALNGEPGNGDIGLSRGAAGKLYLGNGTVGNSSGTLVAGAVGIGTTTPLAFLEVAGTGTNSAILVPRDTTLNRPGGNARNGMIRYNTNTSKFEAYENTGWVNLIGSPTFPLAAPISNSSAPSYSFSSDANTGMFSPLADNLNLATSGVSRLQVDQLGNVAIGTTSQFYVSDSGNVGIGTTSPTAGFPLTVMTNSAGYREIAIYNTAGGNAGYYLNSGGKGYSNYVTAATDAYQIFSDTAGTTVFSIYNNGGVSLGSFAGAIPPANGLLVPGNVGIGTTTPLAFLEVAGTGTNSAILVPRDTTANRPGGNARNGMIRYNTNTSKFEAYENTGWTNIIGSTSFPLFAPISNSSAPSYSFSSDANTGMFSPLADNLNLATSGVSRVQIDQLGNVAIGTTSQFYVSGSGNVGIGTTSPTQKLDIAGVVNSTGYNVGATLYAINQISYNTGAGYSIIGGNAGQGTDVGIIRIGQSATWTNASPLTGGLILGDNASGSNVAGADGYLRSGDGTGTGGSGSLIFQTAPVAASSSTANTMAERMRITPAGNVGIGTSTPLAFLEVAGTGTNSAILVPRDTTANRPGGNARNGMIRYNTNTSKFEAYENTGWTNIIGSTSFPLFAPISNSSAPSYSFSSDANTGMFSPLADNLNFATNSVSRMQIDQLGNVAIGTTSQFYVSGSGNVGVGTSAPGSKLHVQGNVAVPWDAGGNGNGKIGISSSDGATLLNYLSANSGTDYLTGSDVNGIVVNASSNAGTNDLVFQTNSTERVRFKYNGNVGIGTATPARQLDVYSTNQDGFRLSMPDQSLAAFIINNRAYGGSGLTLSQSDTGVAKIGVNSGIRMSIDPSGNVGIGTTAPLALLEVTGTGTNSAILIPSDTTANRPGGNVRNGMLRYNTNTSKFEAYENAGWTNMIGTPTSFPLFAPISNSSAPSYSFSSDANTGMFSPLADNLNFATSGVSRMQIDQLGNVAIGSTSALSVRADGYVGIGTTNPTAPLDVAGQIRSSYNITIDAMSGSNNSHRGIL